MLQSILNKVWPIREPAQIMLDAFSGSDYATCRFFREPNRVEFRPTSMCPFSTRLPAGKHRLALCLAIENGKPKLTFSDTGEVVRLNWRERKRMGRAVRRWIDDGGHIEVA